MSHSIAGDEINDDYREPVSGGGETILIHDNADESPATHQPQEAYAPQIIPFSSFSPPQNSTPDDNKAVQVAEGISQTTIFAGDSFAENDSSGQSYGDDGAAAIIPNFEAHPHLLRDVFQQDPQIRTEEEFGGVQATNDQAQYYEEEGDDFQHSYEDYGSQPFVDLDAGSELEYHDESGHSVYPVPEPVDPVQADVAQQVKEDESHSEKGAEEEEEEERSKKPLPPRGSEVFVGGLSRDVTELDLRAEFEKIGEIYQIRLMADPKTGESKGFGFVRFCQPQAAQAAVQQLDGKKVKGRNIGVVLSNDNQTLFVGHINKEWKQTELEMHLIEAKIEGIHTITIMKDPSFPGKNRGFAFVEFTSHQLAAKAHGRMTRPDFRLGGMVVKCDWAEPLNEPPEEIMKTVKSVYVCNLPPTVDEELMRSIFQEFGEIERIVLSKNLTTARRDDFAFVNYIERESALKAIEARNGYTVNDRVLDVTLAKPVDAVKKHAQTQQQVPASRAGGGAMGNTWRGGAVGGGALIRGGATHHQRGMRGGGGQPLAPGSHMRGRGGPPVYGRGGIGVAARGVGAVHRGGARGGGVSPRGGGGGVQRGSPRGRGIGPRGGSTAVRGGATSHWENNQEWNQEPPLLPPGASPGPMQRKRPMGQPPFQRNTRQRIDPSANPPMEEMNQGWDRSPQQQQQQRGYHQGRLPQQHRQQQQQQQQFRPSQPQSHPQHHVAEYNPMQPQISRPPSLPPGQQPQQPLQYNMPPMAGGPSTAGWGGYSPYTPAPPPPPSMGYSPYPPPYGGGGYPAYGAYQPAPPPPPPSYPTPFYQPYATTGTPHPPAQPQTAGPPPSYPPGTAGPPGAYPVLPPGYQWQ